MEIKEKGTGAENKNEVSGALLGLWEEYAKGYNRSFVQFSLYKKFSKAMEEALLPVAGGVFLDAGCGTGRQLERIIKIAKPSRIVGIDYSPRMLKGAEKTRKWIARKYWIYRWLSRSRWTRWLTRFISEWRFYNCEIELIQANLCKGIPYPDKTFDGQLFHLVLYYLPFRKWEMVLQEAYRVAKPGGYVVTTNMLGDFDIEKGIKAEIPKELALHPWTIPWALRDKRVIARFNEFKRRGELVYPTKRELIEFQKELGFDGARVVQEIYYGMGAVTQAVKPNTRG